MSSSLWEKLRGQEYNTFKFYYQQNVFLWAYNPPNYEEPVRYPSLRLDNVYTILDDLGLIEDLVDGTARLTNDGASFFGPNRKGWPWRLTSEIACTKRGMTSRGAVFLTYSLNLNFFEQLIMPKLSMSGCSHIVVLADAFGYDEALAQGSRNLASVGTRYVCSPLVNPGSGVQHAKLILLTGPRQGRSYWQRQPDVAGLWAQSGVVQLF